MLASFPVTDFESEQQKMNLFLVTEERVRTKSIAVE
jgi:hypothetical protein